MVDTNLKAKVNKVSVDTPKKQEIAPKAQESDIVTTSTDNYDESQSHRYRRLVEGRNTNYAHYEGIQEILYGMGMDETAGGSQETLDCPDYKREGWARELSDKKAIIDRFMAEEKVLEAEIRETRGDLKQMHLLTAPEIKDLKKHEKRLQKLLFEVKQNLKLAQADQKEQIEQWRKDNKEQSDQLKIDLGIELDDE